MLGTHGLSAHSNGSTPIIDNHDMSGAEHVETQQQIVDGDTVFLGSDEWTKLLNRIISNESGELHRLLEATNNEMQVSESAVVSSERPSEETAYGQLDSNHLTQQESRRLRTQHENLKAKNRKAQKRYREKQKARAQNMETQVTELERQLQEETDRHELLQKRNDELERVCKSLANTQLRS